ncbi:MAG: RNA-binding protein [Cellvibrionaceae bacterium]|nr:RNA-binding protein [Cellvibrionaceae bacterium]|tara:strand:- start:34461 stop:34871 length:411 start_codon:yes stop_codon:yes gene_type:complete
MSAFEASKVRVDKWLWAARFFKTRNLAKQAIDGGKVHCDGQRIKPSKEIPVGVELTIRQGWDEKTVAVIALSDQRRGAPEAALLYEETAASIAKREQEADQRKALRGTGLVADRRPNKKQRRQIHRFKHISSEQQD